MNIVQKLVDGDITTYYLVEVNVESKNSACQFCKRIVSKKNHRFDCPFVKRCEDCGYRRDLLEVGAEELDEKTKASLLGILHGKTCTLR